MRDSGLGKDASSRTEAPLYEELERIYLLCRAATTSTLPYSGRCGLWKLRKEQICR